MTDDRPVSIPLLLGTNREGRESEAAAKWLHRKINERGDIRSTYFDVAEFVLPQRDYGTSLGKDYPEWRNAIIEADGLVIVTPEYNHGYPGILKSVLDLLLKEYIHKAVGIVGVSSGPWGGTRVIEACLPMVRELGLAASFRDLHFPRIRDKFDESGQITDPAFNERADGFLDELVWMSKALRWGRENLPSKHHN